MKNLSIIHVLNHASSPGPTAGLVRSTVRTSQIHVCSNGQQGNCELGVESRPAGFADPVTCSSAGVDADACSVISDTQQAS